MSQEFYTIQWKSTQVHMEPAPMPAGMDVTEGLPPAPWELSTCLGSQENLWCAVFRATDQCGGLFALHDGDDTLLIAHAATNMDFVQGMKFFAEMTSNVTYAFDIFMNPEDEEEEDD